MDTTVRKTLLASRLKYNFALIIGKNAAESNMKPTLKPAFNETAGLVSEGISDKNPPETNLEINVELNTEPILKPTEKIKPFANTLNGCSPITPKPFEEKPKDNSGENPKTKPEVITRMTLFDFMA